jgi:hypothetical protein
MEDNGRQIKLIRVAFALGIIASDVLAANRIDGPVWVVSPIEPMFFWVFFLGTI